MLDDPLFRRIRRHAEKRLLAQRGKPRERRLPAYKRFLALEDSMLLRYHQNGDSGIRVTRARAVMMDVMIDSLFQDAMAVYREAHGEPPCKVGILATGGYGRGELNPHSDIDLMFLFPQRVKAETIKDFQGLLVEEVLYILWDLRLKVGHAVRNAKEAIAEAQKEIKSKNAILDARLIAGDPALFQRFQKDYRKFLLRDEPENYIRTRLGHLAARHEKFGGTPYLQEPEIKNGVGGLRDYQNLLWMAQIKLNGKSLDALVEKEYLREDEKRTLEEGYDFLLRVRNQLHFQNKRPTDVLNLENQPQVAYNIGYREKNILKRVEMFMRDYYRHTRDIARICRRVLERLKRNLLPGKENVTLKSVIASRQASVTKNFDGLLLRDGQFHPTRKSIFEDDPERLVRVFRHQQQFEVELSLDLSDLIEASVNLITPHVMNSATANRAFRSILQTPGAVYPVLLEMHELGVLGRFMPEFGELTCLVQHEHYHRYTADIHVLNTIKYLDDVFLIRRPTHAKYRQALRETTRPNLLYLILLLHDLGKALGIKGHAQTGIPIARGILKRLQVVPEVEEEILFIIEQHLEMARFWQRYDIDDPKTAALFARFVGDADRLRLLYVHTYCDACGTSDRLWSSYKDTLHTKLYQETLRVLTPRGEALPDKREVKMGVFEDIRAREIPGISEEEIDAHFSLLPERYFAHHDADDVALHLTMVHELLTTIFEADSLGSLVPVIDWKDDLEQSLTVVNIVTWDRPGLFSKIAGALSVAGINILSTKAISRSDHITIDTFYVAEPGGGVVTNRKARELFEHYLQEALLHNKDLLPEIIDQGRKHRRRIESDAEKLHAPFPPQVDISHELTLKRTILQIQAIDRIGLLYQIARAIFDRGFDINFARISTERGIALDTFYIESLPSKKKQQTENLVKLRDTLTRIIEDEDGEDSGESSASKAAS